MEEENIDFIQKFNYSNSFWENTDVLFQHSKQKFDEYLNISDLYLKLSNSLNDFSESLLDITRNIQDSEIDYESTRSNGVLKVINFIHRISQNLKKFSKSLINISSKMNEKVEVYQSRRENENQCKENYNKYKDNLRKLNLRQDIYNDAVESVIENFLYNKYKEMKNPIDLKPKLENLNKKKQEYKSEVKKCEEQRNEYIKTQFDILEKEEEFEKECTEEIKSNLINTFNFFNQFLENIKVDEDTMRSIEKINGIRDIHFFAENNKDIMSSPPRIIFQEYNQDMDKYFNFDIIKNKMKNKSSEESLIIKKEMAVEVNKFLEQSVFAIDEKKDTITKYSQICDDILNKKLKEEDYNFIINEFESKYTDFMEWKRVTIKEQNYIKVGSGWDDRFESMHIFLHIFNKLRMYNKQLEKGNFDYYVKIMNKIIELNDGEEVDYDLCDLVIILASTFYTMENKEGKEEKIYAAEEIKNCKLFQSFEFWVGLVKNQLNEEIIKDRLKEKQFERRKSFFNNINKSLTNLNININFNLGKKKEENKVNVNKYNKLLMAKLMSVSYNLVQFVSSSDTLNKALYNIFRFYKLSINDKKTVVEMLKFQTMNEGYDYLNLDEDLLYKNKFENYIRKENEDKNDENENITIEKEENKENEKNEIINELYKDETEEDKEKKEEKEEIEEKENDYDEDNIQQININDEIKKAS